MGSLNHSTIRALLGDAKNSPCFLDFIRGTRHGTLGVFESVMQGEHHLKMDMLEQQYRKDERQYRKDVLNTFSKKFSILSLLGFLTQTYKQI